MSAAWIYSKNLTEKLIFRENFGEFIFTIYLPHLHCLAAHYCTYGGHPSFSHILNLPDLADQTTLLRPIFQRKWHFSWTRKKRFQSRLPFELLANFLSFQSYWIIFTVLFAFTELFFTVIFALLAYWLKQHQKMLQCSLVNCLFLRKAVKKGVGLHFWSECFPVSASATDAPISKFYHSIRNLYPCQFQPLFLGVSYGLCDIFVSQIILFQCILS